MPHPLCFVLMPFGDKTDAAGSVIKFDEVYNDLIAPAIREAELEPIRADEEMTGGVIHKPMFERLVLCEYAVADLTTANANVFYELGVRHAARPWSTVLLFSEKSRLPFDVAPLRALPYSLATDGTPVDVDKTKAALIKLLREARQATTDSPLYQLLEDYPDIDHKKTDVFRERVRYSAKQKEKLAETRKQGVDALKDLEKEFGDIKDVESGVVVDLYLSYRAVKAWDDMIALADRMPEPLAATVMVQEQLGLALNRAGQDDRAERVLLELIERRGPSPETYGILGRVYKDRWDAATKGGQEIKAAGLLDKAIDAYLKGFEADWRDFYPGINAVTLMDIKTPPDPRREKLIPIVQYAVERKMAKGKPDYWDHATLLELAVLGKDEGKAIAALADSLAAVREVWEPETTARNLRIIREARESRNENYPWVKKIEDELTGEAEGW